METSKVNKQLQIYEQAIPVTKQRHSDLSVRTGDDYRFAAHLNAVPIMTAEFEALALEYPIVFTKMDDAIMPVVVLGLRNEENLFVTPEGSWRARYLPAFIRRYPFVFAKAEGNDQVILCIDESFSGCNREGQGAALFDADGNETDYFKKMFGFATTFQREAQMTRDFCARLAGHDILTSGEFRFRVGGDAMAATRGLLSVDREKLQALSTEALGDLAKAGDLEKIHAHMLSVRNGEALAARLNKRTAN